MATPKAPSTLLQAVQYFANPDVALTFMASVRWPSGVRCPRCEWDKVSFLKSRRIWKCLGCKKQFSAKVGTVMEDSAIALEKWLPALWLVTNCKNGISSYELARALGVTQKTAWFMLSRLRLAMQDKATGGKLDGDVEIDETYIGGKARNMHKAKRNRLGITQSRSMIGKVAVMGLLQRQRDGKHSTVRLSRVDGTRKNHLMPTIKANVELGSNVYTDALPSYNMLNAKFEHYFIDHAEKYVDGNVHTNGLENFWSLLKRALKGTYVSVEPFHLFRYLDEQAFRFNNRKENDLTRFVSALRGVVGRRLTYTALTGSELPQTC